MVVLRTVYVCKYRYACVYIYICGERERERESKKQATIEASYNLTLLKGPCRKAITRDVEPSTLDLRLGSEPLGGEPGGIKSLIRGT